MDVDMDVVSYAKQCFVVVAVNLVEYIYYFKLNFFNILLYIFIFKRIFLYFYFIEPLMSNFKRRYN